MSAENIAAFVDVTDVVCPITFVKVQVALAEIDDGQLLEIRMNGGDPLHNVPRSLKEEGHLVTAVHRNSDGTFTRSSAKRGITIRFNLDPALAAWGDKVYHLQEGHLSLTG